MARPGKNDIHLRPCLYPPHGAFWRAKRGKWARLGTMLEDALAEYARMHAVPRGGMPDLIDTVLTHTRQNLPQAAIEPFDTAARKLKKMLRQFAPDQVKAKHLAAIRVAIALPHNRKGKTPDYGTVRLQWTKACEAAGFADAHIDDLRAREESLAKGPSIGQSNRQGEKIV
jgi:hypothetical protein